jgi:serine/threonine protein kinase
MVHLDIKPANIGYSPYFQKEVFIDFGFSEFLEEDLG